MGLVQRINNAARRVPVWAVYTAAALWAAWLFWRAVNGDLGVDPVKGLERALGKLGLQLLVAGLAITPLRRLTGINLIRLRRSIGLSAFFYIVLHLISWLVLDMGLLIGQALSDIIKRPYITIGMAAFALLIPLAVTSNNRMVRRLGAVRWQRLHKLTYPAVVLGCVHYFWLVKAWPLEPFVYLGLVSALLLTRITWLARRVAA